MRRRAVHVFRQLVQRGLGFLIVREGHCWLHVVRQAATTVVHVL